MDGVVTNIPDEFLKSVGIITTHSFSLRLDFWVMEQLYFICAHIYTLDDSSETCRHFVLLDSLRPSQQFFSHVGKGCIE